MTLLRTPETSPLYEADQQRLGYIANYTRVFALAPAVQAGWLQLAGAVRDFGPSPGRRLGVLVDHLVPGTKEHRIAAAITHPQVLITGHPYVDVWAGVRPRTLGMTAWPTVPPSQAWKEGVCRALRVDADPPAFWRRLLRSINSYADLEPALVGAVEQLLDFVAPPPSTD